ncbi:MAG: PorP/SprF family type IX secretion system membrane protein [Bacteroidota bacterium]
MMRKLALGFCFSFSLWVNAQEGQFSQYFASSALLNPAMIGTIPNISFNTNYKIGGRRDQESYLELVQATFTYPFQRKTSIDHQIGAAGITFFSERRGPQGIYSSQKVLLNGSYSIQLSKLVKREIIFGLQGGAVQHRLDGSQLQWGSQFSQFIGFDESAVGEDLGSDPVTYPTFNFGVLYYAYDNENAYVRDRSVTLGLSVDNLNRANISFADFDDAQKSYLFRGFGSLKYPIGPRWNIFPSGYVLYSQGSTQINTGLYFSTLVSSVRTRTAVVMQFGSWYRFGDSIIGLVGFAVEDFRVGFSVDYNAQSFDVRREIEGNNISTYELSLTYNFRVRTSFRNVSNPIF